MKKLLLATSAMVLTAGAAAAEVSLSGSARMGIVHYSGGGSSTTLFSSRVRVVFTLSGETDGGLSFGASVRHDQDDAGPGFGVAPGVFNGENTVFISGAFGKLTMGDVSGAADALVGQVSGVGYGPNDDTQEINFIGTIKTAAYYEYSSGPVTFGVGVGQMDLGIDTYNIGVKYSDGGYSAAIAWETIDVGGSSIDMISLGGSATFGDVTVKARVSDLDISGVDTAYALSVDYVAGPTTFTAFYTDYGNSSILLNPYDSTDPDIAHIGLGVAYDLGGGATLAAGVTRQNNSILNDVTIANAGLKFSF
jgi:outer membrane protein OmpU